MTPNRKVLDISHWNTVTDFNAVKNAGIVGIIHKSTEGTGSIDPNYSKVKSSALGVGLLWGAYHWIDAGDPGNQADHMLKVVGVGDETLYAVDWEDDTNNGTASAVQVQAFMEAVEAKIGTNRVVVYSGNVAKEKLGSSKNVFFGAHRLWLAQYSSNPVAQASWSKIWLWQYSDGNNGPPPHGCPGVSGNVDTNSYSGSDAQLISEWSGSAAPEPKPDIPQVSIITSGAVQIVVNGRVISTPDV